MKYLIIVAFLIINHTANAQNSPFQQKEIKLNTSNLLNYQKDESILKSKKQMPSLLSRKRNSKKMPNLFVGGNYMNFNMGRFAGFFSYSIDAVYNHELFSAQARSTFAYNVSPKTDEFLMDKYPNAYRTFNITEVFGTYFLFSYKSKQKYKAFTGKTKELGTRILVFYRPKKTIKINKLGVRIGLLHDQEDAFESSNFIEVDNYTITSYSANSLTIGISKTAMAQVFYGKFNYMKNSNLYFDVLFKVSGTETYKKNISVNEFEIADGLDLFDYRKGWRIGYESRTNNSTFNFLSLYSAIEVGVMPVPKYTPSSGFYFLLRFGIMFYRTVG